MKILIILPAMLLQFGILYSQDSLRKIVNTPNNLKEAHTELIRLLPADVVSQMKQGSQDDMIQYHFSIGMWIRNKWGLWQGSMLSKYLDSLGVKEPDEQSGVILNTFWRRLNNRVTNDNSVNMFPECDRIFCPSDSSELVLIDLGSMETDDHKSINIYKVKCSKNNHVWEYDYKAGLKPEFKR